MFTPQSTYFYEQSKHPIGEVPPSQPMIGVPIEPGLDCCSVGSRRGVPAPMWASREVIRVFSGSPEFAVLDDYTTPMAHP